MNTEEAKQVLNEAVISQPSIEGYTYISAEEINEAIEILLKTLEEKESEIAVLNEILLQKESKRGLTNILFNKVGKKMILGKNSILEEI